MGQQGTAVGRSYIRLMNFHNMKLLFVTQKMDKDDSVLGAYHGWVIELAKRFENITVICLFEGKHELPENVSVYSLGKEKGEVSSLVYAIRFKKLAWKLRHEYDAVFVHMNQEYILIAGCLWKLLGKRIYMWRNHYAGSWATDLAAAFCTKVFCTSRYSYTAKYKKTVFMPVGIPISRFNTDSSIVRMPRSILFLSRIAPSKHPDILLEALVLLKQKGIAFTASFYGDPIPENESYYDFLKQKSESAGLSEVVKFHAGIPNAETPDVYRAHEIFVNCSPSGMFDKTIFEAAASGCLVLASSKDFAALAGEQFYFDRPESLAKRLETMLALSASEEEKIDLQMQFLAQKQSLATLVDSLVREIVPVQKSLSV
jgi:glycosyltransferase involved in cell wall biosynthesis